MILNNVPAYRIRPDFLSALDFFVREQGGGLLMAGGKNSFGAGGYCGEQRLDLPSVWKSPRPTGTTPLRLPILIALLVAMLAEFLLTRLGWKSGFRPQAQRSA